MPASHLLIPRTSPTHRDALALDRVLEILERRRLSATEWRVLLELADGEASVPGLADTLDQPPVEVTRVARTLSMRGLIRRRHARTRYQTRLAITAPGLATIRALQAASREDQPRLPLERGA